MTDGGSPDIGESNRQGPVFPPLYDHEVIDISIGMTGNGAREALHEEGRIASRKILDHLVDLLDINTREPGTIDPLEVWRYYDEMRNQVYLEATGNRNVPLAVYELTIREVLGACEKAVHFFQDARSFQQANGADTSVSDASLTTYTRMLDPLERAAAGWRASRSTTLPIDATARVASPPSAIDSVRARLVTLSAEPAPSVTTASSAALPSPGPSSPAGE